MLATGNDPGGSGSLVAAALWVEQVLLGSAATAVAVIAVATIGFMMLAGRVDWRRAATVILGCFIIFGARSVAVGIASAAGSGSGYYPTSQPAFTAPPPPAPSAPPATAPPSAPADPFAGAAVPTR